MHALSILLSCRFDPQGVIFLQLITTTYSENTILVILLSQLNICHLHWAKKKDTTNEVITGKP